MDRLLLERELEKYKVVIPHEINNKAEYTKMPGMINVFRGLIHNDLPPSLDTFLKNYKEKFPEYIIQGSISRLTRAYLSFVREYHLGFLLKENFDNVIYDLEKDINGVDYVILHNNKVYNIHAFVDTRRGNKWRAVKERWHNFQGIHLDLPLNLSEGKRVGYFILYTPSNILYIYNIINNITK